MGLDFGVSRGFQGVPCLSRGFGQPVNPKPQRYHYLSNDCSLADEQDGQGRRLDRAYL